MLSTSGRVYRTASRRREGAGKHEEASAYEPNDECPSFAISMQALHGAHSVVLAPQRTDELHRNGNERSGASRRMPSCASSTTAN